jgi:hypothetical protein
VFSYYYGLLAVTDLPYVGWGNDKKLLEHGSIHYTPSRESKKYIMPVIPFKYLLSSNINGHVTRHCTPTVAIQALSNLQNVFS